MQLTINQVVDDRDYEDALRVRNIDNDFNPMTLEESRNWDAINPPSLVFERYLGRDDRGHAISRGVIREERMPEGKLFFLDISLANPESAADWKPMFELVERRAIELGGTTLGAMIRDTRPTICESLEGAGFHDAQRNPLSALDLTTFDSTPFEPAIERARKEGLELMSLQQYADRFGEWKRPYYEVTLEVFKDVPQPVPFVEWPYEEFELWMDSPAWKSDCRFVAVDGQKIVAVSEYDPRKADPKLAQTFLTGTLRPFRRKGLATALKTMALLSARARGVERIFTDNEENNPMFQLNVALGFRKVWDWIFYKKEV